MNYVLRCQSLQSSKKCELSEDEFAVISTARRNLLEVLAIEDKYDLLVRNYRAFEQVVFDSSITGVLYAERSWSDFIEHIQAANLSLMNLMSMCRSYVDHVPQHLSCIFPDNSEIKKTFHDERKSVHADFLGYRALYQIRNHVQHCGLPVHSFTLGSRLEGEDAFRHNAVPYVSVAELAKDKSFNKNILRELQHIGERVDLRVLVRENMSAFGRIHRCVRGIVKSRVVESDEIISERIDAASVDCNPSNPVLILETIDNQQNVLEASTIFRDLIDRRKHLENKNRLIVNMERHFITSRIEK